MALLKQAAEGEAAVLFCCLTAPSSEGCPRKSILLLLLNHHLGPESSLLLCLAPVFLGESWIWWICLLKAAAEVRCGFLWAGMGGFSQEQAAEPSACLRNFGPSRRGWNDGKVTVASGNVLPLGKEGWMCACAGRKRGESNSRNCNNSRLFSLLQVFVLKQRRAHA